MGMCDGSGGQIGYGREQAQQVQPGFSAGGGYTPQPMPAQQQFMPQPYQQQNLGSGPASGGAPSWFSQPGQQAQGLASQLGGVPQQSPLMRRFGGVNLGGQGGGSAPSFGGASGITPPSPQAPAQRIATRSGARMMPGLLSDNFAR